MTTITQVYWTCFSMIFIEHIRKFTLAILDTSKAFLVTLWTKNINFATKRRHHRQKHRFSCTGQFWDLCSFRLAVFFSDSEPGISTSLVLTYTKLSSFITIYILKVFYIGVCSYSFIAWFIEHFIPKSMAQTIFFMAVDSIFWLMKW